MTYRSCTRINTSPWFLILVFLPKSQISDVYDHVCSMSMYESLVTAFPVRVYGGKEHTSLRYPHAITCRKISHHSETGHKSHFQIYLLSASCWGCVTAVCYCCRMEGQTIKAWPDGLPMFGFNADRLHNSCLYYY